MSAAALCWELVSIQSRRFRGVRFFGQDNYHTAILCLVLKHGVEHSSGHLHKVAVVPSTDIDPLLLSFIMTYYYASDSLLVKNVDQSGCGLVEVVLDFVMTIAPKGLDVSRGANTFGKIRLGLCDKSVVESVDCLDRSTRYDQSVPMCEGNGCQIVESRIDGTHPTTRHYVDFDLIDDFDNVVVHTRHDSDFAELRRPFVSPKGDCPFLAGKLQNPLFPGLGYRLIVVGKKLTTVFSMFVVGWFRFRLEFFRSLAPRFQRLVEVQKIIEGSFDRSLTDFGRKIKKSFGRFRGTFLGVRDVRQEFLLLAFPFLPHLLVVEVDLPQFVQSGVVQILTSQS